MQFTPTKVWDVPEDLRPEECGLHTKNLIGWSRATILSLEQRIVLEGAGVTEENLGVMNQQFQLNKGLFENVADFLWHPKITVKLALSVHESARGSVSQVVPFHKA